jgi:hypothetical protein
MTRRRWIVLAVVMALLGLAALGLPCSGSGSGSSSGSSSVVSLDFGSDRVSSSSRNVEDQRVTSGNSRVAAESARAHADAPEPAGARTSKRALDEAERVRLAALREQILAAQRSREAAATAAEGPHQEPMPEPPPSEGLTNHVDGYDELVDELNRNFLPLSDECIADALERRPELAGVLEVGFQLIVDDDLGSVIESVEIPAHGEVVDAQLHECMRESLLSMMLPPGEEPGSEPLMLSLRVP